MRQWISAAIVSLVLPAWATAAINLVAESKLIMADPINPVESYVDVYVSVSQPESRSVAGWQAYVDLDSGTYTGVTFGTPTRTNVGTNPRATLLNGTFTSPYGVDTNTPSHASANEFVSVSVPLTGNDGAGLMRIPLTVAPGTVGVFSINFFVDGEDGTALFDDSFEGMTMGTPVSGIITVVPVPEPATFGILALGATGLLLRRRSRAAC